MKAAPVAKAKLAASVAASVMLLAATLSAGVAWNSRASSMAEQDINDRLASVVIPELDVHGAALLDLLWFVFGAKGQSFASNTVSVVIDLNSGDSARLINYEGRDVSMLRLIRDIAVQHRLTVHIQDDVLWIQSADRVRAALANSGNQKTGIVQRASASSSAQLHRHSTLRGGPYAKNPSPDLTLRGNPFDEGRLVDRHSPSVRGGGGRGTHAVEHPIGDAVEHPIENSMLRGHPSRISTDERDAVWAFYLDMGMEKARERRGAALQKRLANVILPELNLSEMTLRDAAEFLQTTARESLDTQPGEKPFQLILKLSDAEAATLVGGLHGRNISLLDAVKVFFYGLNCCYDDNRIVVENAKRTTPQR